MPTALPVASRATKTVVCGSGHLLGRHLELVFARRQRNEVRVELGHHGAHVVLQRRLDGDGDRRQVRSFHDLGHHEEAVFAQRALATMSAALPPSVTTSARIFIFISTTEVIGSTPATSTSSSCCDEAEDAVELADHAFGFLAAIRRCGQGALRA